MRSEPLAWQARLLTASALDQSPGAGDLVDERRGEGRESLWEAGRDCWGEGFLNTSVFRILPLAKEWRRGGRE